MRPQNSVSYQGIASAILYILRDERPLQELGDALRLFPQSVKAAFHNKRTTSRTLRYSVISSTESVCGCF